MDPHEEFQMNLEKNRNVTFSDWPFDNEDCQCTSKNLAAAGFYHIPSDNKEPDLVKCFVCLKELEGWEPEDDPWKEHKKHSPKCALVKLNKKETEWKVEDVLRLEIKRQENIVRSKCQADIDYFTANAAKVREMLEEM